MHGGGQRCRGISAGMGCEPHGCLGVPGVHGGSQGCTEGAYGCRGGLWVQTGGYGCMGGCMGGPRVHWGVVGVRGGPWVQRGHLRHWATLRSIPMVPSAPLRWRPGGGDGDTQWGHPAGTPPLGAQRVGPRPGGAVGRPWVPASPVLPVSHGRDSAPPQTPRRAATPLGPTAPTHGPTAPRHLPHPGPTAPVPGNGIPQGCWQPCRSGARRRGVQGVRGGQACPSTRKEEAERERRGGRKGKSRPGGSPMLPAPWLPVTPVPQGLGVGHRQVQRGSAGQRSGGTGCTSSPLDG